MKENANNEIIIAYNKCVKKGNVSYSAISRMTDYSRFKIKSVLKKNNLVTEFTRKKPDELEKSILSAYHELKKRNGYVTAKMIVKECDCGNKSVRRYLSRHNLKLDSLRRFNFAKQREQLCMEIYNETKERGDPIDYRVIALESGLSESSVRVYMKKNGIKKMVESY